MLVLLARHAERDDFKDEGHWSHAWWKANASGRPWDAPLSAAGQLQAADLGSLIRKKLEQHGEPDGHLTAYTSPFIRCFETASLALERLGRSATLNVDRGLSEHLRADWFDAATAARPDFLLTGKALSAARAGVLMEVPSVAVLSLAAYPEGDPELQARASNVATSLVSIASGPDAPAAVLLVTHGGVLISILKALLSQCGYPETSATIPHQGYAALSTVNITPRATGSGCDLAVHKLGELPLRLTATQLWFAGQEPVWNTLLIPWLRQRKLETNGVISVLELGSWEGASATWLLCNACDASADSRLTCVDHYDKLRTAAGAERAQKFAHNTRVTALWPRVNLMADFTVPALSRLLMERREWDLIYVDASHEAHDTLLDAMLSWKGLRQGGMMVFDDYQWPEFPEDSPHHPKAGIDAFLRVHEHELELIHKGYQVIVKKLFPPRFNF